MKTIYAKNSYDAYKNLCLASDSIIDGFEDANVKYTRDGDRFVSGDGELEVIILDTDKNIFEDQLVLTQGSLFFAIGSFFKRLNKIKHEIFDKILSITVIDGDDSFEFKVGIDFCNDEDDNGNVYPFIDDLEYLCDVPEKYKDLINKEIKEMFEQTDIEEFLELDDLEVDF